MSSDGPGKTGRPTVRTPELIDAILAEIRAGSPPSLAAVSQGISARTFREWRQKDPELAATVASADSGTGGKCWRGLLKAAEMGDVKAAAYILDKRFADFAEVDEGAMQDHAARLYRIGQQMRGSVPTEPGQGAVQP